MEAMKGYHWKLYRVTPVEAMKGSVEDEIVFTKNLKELFVNFTIPLKTRPVRSQVIRIGGVR